MSYPTTAQLLSQLGGKNPHMKLELRALQACYDFWDQKPDLVNRLWEDVFISAPRQITIPHYLAFIEGWGRKDFCDEFHVTAPTYYRWLLTTKLPFKRKRDFLNALDQIDEPEDLVLMLEARDNEDQWVVPSKSHDYKPSRKLIGWAESKMQAYGQLDIREYHSQNPYRTKMQMRTLAYMRYWREESDGIFTSD